MSFYKVGLSKNTGELGSRWSGDLKTFKGVENFVKNETKGTNKMGMKHCTGAMGKKHTAKY